MAGLLQPPFFAACGGGKEGGSEDTSRSGKGLSPSALLQAYVVFPILQQPCVPWFYPKGSHGHSQGAPTRHHTAHVPTTTPPHLE